MYLPFSGSLMGNYPPNAITVEQEAACGCWVSRSYHPEGELLELHVQICEEHMNNLSEDIELRIRSETDQLTLPLPSRTATEDGRPNT